MRYLRMSVIMACACALAVGGVWSYRDGLWLSLLTRTSASTAPASRANTATAVNTLADVHTSSTDNGMMATAQVLKGTVPVVAIGGSAAYGWDDTKTDGGYLARTFRDLSNASTSSSTYPFTNASVEGDGPIQFTKTLPSILQKDQPKLVVISFGMLDDLYKKTPQKQINRALVEEVNDALAAGAVVAFVTPPITGASYSEFAKTEGPSLQSEIQAVKQIHNPNVHVVDLFSQMKAYLASHQQTWHTYAADGWHPNAAGHKLAATILTHDLKSSGWF